MSWSVMFIGHPENILAALKTESEKLTGSSKEEYDKALPNLQALVSQNFNENPDSVKPVLKLSASGHTFSQNDKPVYASCSVCLETLGGLLV